ncbi:hypothetical protein, partial [Asticcacaulis benevestitus]|uniref:hypothetical protein n=1 Tax=Asticcacaulis benevestitus TaxID=347481 RepID=UPI00055626BF
AAVDVLWLYDQNGTPALADYIKSQNDRKVTRFSDTIAQLELADVMVIEALYRHFHNLPFRYKEKPDYQKVVIPAETDEGKAAIEAHEGSRKYLSALYDLKEGQDLVEEGS